MRICDVHVVPLATNYMAAKHLIDSLSIKIEQIEI